MTGVLQPSEDSDVSAVSSSIDRITTPDLVTRTGMTMHDGYLVQAPAPQGVTEVTPVITSPVSVPLHWRNIVYVGNWIVFAFIVIAMWVRVMRDEMTEMRGVEADER